MSGTAAGGVSFLVALALVPLLVKFAVGRNLLDVPNLRSSHAVPTPRLGGVAILAGTWAGAALLGLEEAWPLLFAATLVWFVGLLDDLRNLHFGTKAAAQTIVAAGLLLLYPPPLLSDAPNILKVLVFAVGLFWLAALSNAFNFMDGIDGLVGGAAVVGALFLVPLAGGADAGTGAFLPALAGAAAGFLVWNVGPASIFLGDSGSYFLGFSLAAATLYAPPPAGWSPLPFLAGVLVFTPLLFDTAYTLLRRLKAGKNVFSAHREHIYQRITPSPAMHRRTSNLYYAAGVLAGFAALLAAAGGAAPVLSGVAVALAVCGGLLALPRLVRTGPDDGLR